MPLSTMTCKDTLFQWTSLLIQAFARLKLVLVSAPTLALPNPKQPFIVMTNALNIAMGAVLSQPDDHDELHPVAFKSHKLTNAEKNYPVHKKEILAIIKALQAW